MGIQDFLQISLYENFTILNSLISIILSLISACIFWIFFSYWPEKKRSNKLRPVVEIFLFNVYRKIFSIFDTIMRHAEHSPSFYQSDIISGKLSKNDIELGLQNKCLNKHYKYDLNINIYLLIIGQKVQDDINDIDKLLNRILSYYTYATTEELLLLEDIREKIHTYFNERYINHKCEYTINGEIMRPVNPTLSSYKENFYEIYLLFCKLQKIVLRKKFTNRDHFINKVQWLYYSDEYRLCIKATKKAIKNQADSSEEDLVFYRSYLALSARNLNKMRLFYKYIDEIYSARPYNGSLVSSRSTLENVIKDKKVVGILNKYHTSEEITDLRKSIQQEKLVKEKFISNNKMIKEYIDKAIKKNRNFV